MFIPLAVPRSHTVMALFVFKELPGQGERQTVVTSPGDIWRCFFRVLGGSYLWRQAAIICTEKAHGTSRGAPFGPVRERRNDGQESGRGRIQGWR